VTLSTLIARVATGATVTFMLMNMSACRLRNEPTYIHAVVTVRVCPASSSDCYNLRVPSADIAAAPTDRRTGPAVTGVVDEAGEASLRLQPGEYNISAQSFALKGGETSVKATAVIGKTTTVRLVGDLVALK
jgi:hypothetical protein